MKLYTNKLDHLLFQYPAIVQELTQQNDIENVVVSQEVQDSEAFKAKRGVNGKFPMLEQADGKMLFESNAIALYIARRSASHAGALCGHDAFEEAQINMWIMSNAMNLSAPIQVAYQTFGSMFNEAVYADSCKEMKERAKKINEWLSHGRTFLVGQRLTLADISNFLFMSIGFAFIFDAGFRKAMPHISEWFQRVAAQSAVINVAGCLKMCEKSIKAIDASKLPQVAAPVVKKIEEVVKAAPAKPAEDEFDPFASDEEDAEAEAEKQARFKELAKTAKSYGKAKATAKSLIVWEVKPWGEETDLDEMAKMILAIEMDGLYWKTEYKKEPIAYGVFKIIIGATIEDDKVSTDEVAELIEALEDHV